MSAIGNFSRFIMGQALRRSRRSVPARPERHQSGLWCRLCGCLSGRLGGCRHGLACAERRAAAPGMIGDVEQYFVRPVEFGLVETLLALGPAREACGAERLELVGGAVHVIDQHAEMVDAAEIEAVALVPAETPERHVEGAVAQEHAI